MTLEEIIAGFSRFGGETAALGAACLWAAATMCFRRIGQVIPPLRMNLLKNLLAALMLAATLLATGEWPSGIETGAVALFLVSGAVGIGFGDSAYFGALRTLGARRSLLMLVLAPPLTAILSSLFLDETLAAGAWLGVLATTAGVAWVISERTSASGPAAPVSLRGIGLGAMAVIGQSAGSVLSHAAFMQFEVGAMSSAWWRLTGGTLAVLLVLPFERVQVPSAVDRPSVVSLFPLIGFTVFIGTYLGLWLQQLSLKLASAGVAQTLLSTSPLFVLPMAAWAGEPVSPRAVAGALLAVAGAGLLFWLG